MCAMRCHYMLGCVFIRENAMSVRLDSLKYTPPQDVVRISFSFKALKFALSLDALRVALSLDKLPKIVGAGTEISLWNKL